MNDINTLVDFISLSEYLQSPLVITFVIAQITLLIIDLVMNRYAIEFFVYSVKI